MCLLPKNKGKNRSVNSLGSHQVTLIRWVSHRPLLTMPEPKSETKWLLRVMISGSQEALVEKGTVKESQGRDPTGISPPDPVGIWGSVRWELWVSAWIYLLKPHPMAKAGVFHPLLTLTAVLGVLTTFPSLGLDSCSTPNYLLLPYKEHVPQDKNNFWKVPMDHTSLSGGWDAMMTIKPSPWSRVSVWWTCGRPCSPFQLCWAVIPQIRDYPHCMTEGTTAWSDDHMVNEQRQILTLGAASARTRVPGLGSTQSTAGPVLQAH